MSALPDGLLAYFAAREHQRAEEVEARLDALSPRERWLVREAAVMGYVQGVRAVPGSFNQHIPPDGDIERLVVGAVGSFTDLYPVLSGSVRDVIRKVVRNHQPVPRADLVAVVAELSATNRETAEFEVGSLVDDELLTEVDGKLRESA